MTGRITLQRRASRRFALCLVLLLLGNAAAAATIRTHIAAADNAFSGGDCWIVGTPLQCSAGYTVGAYYYYSVTTYWAPSSTIRTNAEPGMNQAMNGWTNAPGPQIFWSSGGMTVLVEEFPYVTSGDPIYDNGMYNPPQGGAGVAFATTRNWRYDGAYYYPCYSSACNISFSEVYMSQPWAATCSGGRGVSAWKYLVGHEFGHTQGLGDHSSGNILMNNSWPTSCAPTTSAREATATDYGNAVPSGATNCTSPRGIRCIFKWSY